MIRAWTHTTCTCTCTTTYSILIVLLLLGLNSCSCNGLGTFGFDIHHRFSDPVKGILGLDKLPETGGVDYYVAMAHRDRIIRGRHLAASNNQSPLTFANGNDTYLIGSLGFLHYANVSVGKPSLSFMVALDTGSDLLWLPCDCEKGGCVDALNSSAGVINLNIYSPNSSSTSGKIPCNSTLCGQSHCSSANSNCDYKVVYLSNNTSSSGILVEDLLHLISDDDPSKAVEAKIAFGCGQSQTGTFLEGAAPNGLFGLGIDGISVPSTLAKLGLASNSFSMCFGPDGIGRIKFGDIGSSGQSKTSFNVRSSHPTYNISVTQITMGSNVSKLEFSAIFDSGTSFTSLSDPAYTFISESFNSQVSETRQLADPQLLPFEYCYGLSANQTNFLIPKINLTMKGGEQYILTDPIVQVVSDQGGNMYCLALLKSESINIIGQNFMTGYNIVFDREKMELGWKASNCYDNGNLSTLSINPSQAPADPPALPINPQATEKSGNKTDIPAASPTSHSSKLKSFNYAFTMLLLSLFVIV